MLHPFLNSGGLNGKEMGMVFLPRLLFSSPLTESDFWRGAMAQVDGFAGDCVLEGMAHAGGLSEAGE